MSYAEPNEYALAREDRDNREAQEDDAPDEYEIMQHDDHRYENHG
jgi:hypothetical protein